jgi:hemolysin activation/secretion protein
LHAERINQLSTLTFDSSVSGPVNEIPTGDLENLGRAGTDDRYATIDFNLGWSAFLEPLLRPSAWRDPSNELSATLAHELSVGVRGQYAFDYRLIPQTSQTLGGFFSVRGYDQSVAVGDTVVVGSFEYRFHLPRALPVSRQPLRLPLVGDFRVAPQQVYGRPDWDFMLRAFVDVGRALRNDPSSDLNGPTEWDQTLVGAGVGAELVIRSNFRARLDWAAVLNDTVGRIDNGAEVGDNQLHALFSILY